MRIRKEISVLLLLLSILLALLPLSTNRSFSAKPDRLLSDVLNRDASFTVDQVAEFIVREDSTVQLIDVRSPEEFRNQTIPGAINIPYSEFISKDPDIWLNNKNIRNIFYSAGDLESYYTLVYARGLGYENCYVMDGGMNEWISTVV
ncbi:MAG: rhodanese-like domain-containing protein, partial [Bacteroidales bacterium]|nr:rhodanese-like domain-containing protein [Bacteroidales bacterium]